MRPQALADPANVATAAALAVAAMLLQAWWLLAVAAAAYAAMTALTVRERRLAAAPGRAPVPPRAPGVELSAPVAKRLRAGLAAADAIRAAIDEADVPLDDVAHDVADLRAAMESLAARADRVHRYLGEQDPAAVRARLAVEAASDDTVRGRLAEALAAQLGALERLRTQLDRLLSELDHVVAALQAMHAEVLGMAAMAGGWHGRELSSRVGDLQERVGALGAGLEEVYAETRVSVGRRGT